MPDATLTSDVTGTVWKIEVRAGDSVTEGQDIVVLA